MLILELVVDATKVAPRIGGEERSRLIPLLAVTAQRAPEPRHPLVPRELHEGLWLGNANQLRRLRPVAEILAAPVEEEIHGGGVEELEGLFLHAFPMFLRHARPSG